MLSGCLPFLYEDEEGASTTESGLPRLKTRLAAYPDLLPAEGGCLEMRSVERGICSFEKRLLAKEVLEGMKKSIRCQSYP